MSEETEQDRTLWMLVYDEGSGYQLKPFYAVSEEDVEKQVQAWMNQIGHGIKRICLRHHPHGFTVQYSGLPGKV